ncbi:nuclear transport factor 2 family protein [Actinoplanes sp. NPDC049596]|uniref:nuclear transport factor 2 family protein n=1 Tax=unclassified Actinoplanes TaxID=2626549 RepID=UPI003440631B
MTHSSDAAHVMSLEIDLQRPVVRRDRAAVRALLHPDFHEVDSTGRVWTVDTVVEALAVQTGYVQPTVTDLVAAEVTPDVLLLTYRDAKAVHSSWWVRATGTWKLRFHQQTRDVAGSSVTAPTVVEPAAPRIDK